MQKNGLNPVLHDVERLRVLAEFRQELRRFLHFSEEAARNVGLPVQQHQLLLQIAGAPEGTAVTVAYLAERLKLRHNSVVELSMRCEEAGLAQRVPDDEDRRRVILRLTPAGMEIMESLAEAHARELNELGPKLADSLERIQALTRRRGRQ
jgi:DNA-binding MarR family transcriptional regulator